MQNGFSNFKEQHTLHEFIGSEQYLRNFISIREKVAIL